MIEKAGLSLAKRSFWESNAFGRRRRRIRSKPRQFCLAACAIALCTASALAHAHDTAPLQPTPVSVPLISGVELQYFDNSVRPQDDFYRYVNGKWLESTDIPADKSSYGSFVELRDETLSELRSIIEKLQSLTSPAEPQDRKVADLYASFMDESALEQLNAKPLDAQLAEIETLHDKADIAPLLARFHKLGISAGFVPRVHLDAKDPTRYAFELRQGGLSLPDRDYYLLNNEKFVAIRGQYEAHVTKMLALVGDPAAAQNAKDVLALETALARIQWTKVQNRDPVKTYNKLSFGELASLVADFNWATYLEGNGIGTRTDFVLVAQPSYFEGLNTVLRDTPLDVWKAYLRWHLVSDLAPYLSKNFVDEDFSFYGKVLRGTEQDEPRWKRGIRLVDQSIGEALGKLYVDEFFPPQAKDRMDRLVKNLLEACKTAIGSMEWMGPVTRQRAQEKLAKFATKIGYPAKWRDYSALRIERGDLLGNVLRARAFEFDRELRKLGRPVDRGEWEMTPQTVNAYYNPEMNEIVFPAAILRPPFFNARADDAINYGGIGAVIGHEISHGFDDQGSQYDGDGKLLGTPGWFTEQDLTRFRERTHALVEQYAAYAPVPGFPINGELTLGENIADNAGLAIAYRAYRLSLDGAQAPVMDGFSGDQRFFIGWAQVWRSKTRENQAILWIKSNPHSPAEFRGLLPERNLAPFYGAFGVKPGDKMYLAPDKRVTIW